MPHPLPQTHVRAPALLVRQRTILRASGLRPLRTALASVALLPLIAAAQQSVATRARGAQREATRLRIYYVGYPVGYETWQLTTGPNGIRTLAADLDYVDRGRRTRLHADLRLADDWSPTRLVISRKTDSTSVEEARTELLGRTARVDYRGKHDTVAVPAHVFAIAGTSPVAQHLALVRHWLARGKPATLAVIPGGPTNTVDVAWRGRDTLQLAGAARDPRPLRRDRRGVGNRVGLARRSADDSPATPPPAEAG